MKQIKKIEPVSTFLTLFIALLTLLLYYLYKIEQSVENYHTSHDRLVKLEFLDKGLNDFTTASNELTNYNYINNDIETFRKNLDELEKNVLVGNRSLSLVNDFKRIKSVFKEKVEDIEYFKSLNSSLIAGSHFLFDLQRTISESKNISYDMKSLVNETLFYLFQFTQSDYIDKQFVLNKLQQIQKRNKKENAALVENFYNQAKVLLETLASYRKCFT
ncbi:MAG: hypothetical protein P8Y22_05200 [Sulfurimonas sp.]